MLRFRFFFLLGLLCSLLLRLILLAFNYWRFLSCEENVPLNKADCVSMDDTVIVAPNAEVICD